MTRPPLSELQEREATITQDNYSHRNGEAEPPLVEGFFWMESIDHGWFTITKVNLGNVKHHEWLLGQGIVACPYRYYGPIPQPTPRKE